MVTQTSELLIELKNKKTKKPLKFQQLICILNQGQIKEKQVTKYLKEVYDIQEKPLNWLQMGFEQIQHISTEAMAYKLQYQDIWKEEQERQKRQQQERIIMEKQKERLRLLMIKKNLTKQKMIEMCKQSIVKCQKILQLGVDDTQQYNRVKQSVKQLKRQLLILRGNYFEDLKSSGNIHLIPKSQIIEAQENPQVQEIIREIKERRQRIQNQRLRQIQRKKRQQDQLYAKRIKTTIKRLVDIFFYYTKEKHYPVKTFQQNLKKRQIIDMHLFIKYLKDFQIIQGLQHQEKQKIKSFTNQQIKHNHFIKIKEAALMFKQLAYNTISMDIKGFIQFHLNVVGLSDCAYFGNLKNLIQKLVIEKQSHEINNYTKPKKYINQQSEEQTINTSKIYERYNQKQQQTQVVKFQLYSKLDTIVSKQKIQKLMNLQLVTPIDAKVKQKSFIMSNVQKIKIVKKQEQKNKIQSVVHKSIEKSPTFKRLRNLSYSKIFHLTRDTNQLKSIPLAGNNEQEQKYKSLNLQKKQSLPKITKEKYIKPISIYDSIKQIKAKNKINDQDFKELFSSKILKVGNESKEDEDEMFLAQFLKKQKASEKSKVTKLNKKTIW